MSSISQTTKLWKRPLLWGSASLIALAALTSGLAWMLRPCLNIEVGPQATFRIGAPDYGEVMEEIGGELPVKPERVIVPPETARLLIEQLRRADAYDPNPGTWQFQLGWPPIRKVYYCCNSMPVNFQHTVHLDFDIHNDGREEFDVRVAMSIDTKGLTCELHVYEPNRIESYLLQSTKSRRFFELIDPFLKLDSIPELDSPL